MDDKEIQLKDYEMVREEAHATIGNRNSILSYGLATIGVVSAGILTVGDRQHLRAIAVAGLIYGVPAMSALVLMIWLGEVERMVRAGRYLVRIETQINTMCGHKVLAWASSILLNRQDVSYPYFATIILFEAIVFGAPLFGCSLAGIPLRNVRLAFPWSCGAATLVFVTFRLALMHRENSRLRREVGQHWVTISPAEGFRGEPVSTKKKGRAPLRKPRE